MKLLTENFKTRKSSGRSHRRIFIQHFAPAALSGDEVCSRRTAACTAYCLNTAGMGVFKNVQQARVNRTRFYFDDKLNYIERLDKEIAVLVNKFGQNGIAIRLNGTSDLDFPNELRDIMVKWDNIIFYDYTKNLQRVIEYGNGHFTPNYYLVFSTRGNYMENLVALHHTSLVIVDGVDYIHDSLIDTYDGMDGDNDDCRWLDTNNKIIYLKPKGKARKFKGVT
jgi:hypothetical protein